MVQELKALDDVLNFRLKGQEKQAVCSAGLVEDHEPLEDLGESLIRFLKPERRQSG